MESKPNSQQSKHTADTRLFDHRSQPEEIYSATTRLLDNYMCIAKNMNQALRYAEFEGIPTIWELQEDFNGFVCWTQLRKDNESGSSRATAR